MSLSLGFASHQSVIKRNYAAQVFTGHDIHGPTGLPDNVSYPLWKEWFIEAGGDASTILKEDHRKKVALNLTQKFQKRIEEIGNEPENPDTLDDNLMKQARFQDAINKANREHEKDQSNARSLLEIIKISMSTNILVEIQPTESKYLEDSQLRLFAIIDYLDAKYSPKVSDQNKLILQQMNQIGRAETTGQLKNMITAFQFFLLKQREALFTKNPVISARISGMASNQRAIDSVNREVSDYRDTVHELRAEAALHGRNPVYPRVPVLVYPYPVPSAAGPIAVHNYIIGDYYRKVNTRKACTEPEDFDTADSNDLLPPIPTDMVLKDPFVRPLPNLELLEMLRKRLESNPHSEIFMYRQMVLAAEESNRPHEELFKDIDNKLAKDTPSQNHLDAAIHAAHAAVHGRSASASAHSSTATEILNDVLDHNSAHSYMAIGTGSNNPQLESRIRVLESELLNNNKRTRFAPCKFWGLDQLTGIRSCGRQTATNSCPFASYHDPTILTPAAEKWLSHEEFLATRASPFGSAHAPMPPAGAPVPMSLASAPALGQSLRHST